MMSSTVFGVGPLAYAVISPMVSRAESWRSSQSQSALKEETVMLMNGYHWGSSRWESKQWRGAPDSTSRGLRRAEGCSLGEYHWVHNATKRGCDDSLGMKKGPVFVAQQPHGTERGPVSLSSTALFRVPTGRLKVTRIRR